MSQDVGTKDGKIYREKSDGTSGYWHEYHLSPTAFKTVGVAPTYVPADGNTTGGYQLDADTKKIEYTADTHTDWDGSTDPELELVFEVAINNGGGLVTDTVDIDVVFTLKGEGETVVKAQTINDSVVVGQSAQWKQFRTTVLLDHDSGTDPLDPGDIVTMTIVLNTGASEVDDIIFCAANYKYATTEPAEERS